MQGELADTGAHILSQAEVGKNNDPSAPSLGAERAFNQAINAADSAKPINAVNEVDVSNLINDFRFPRVGEISDISQSHLSMKDLDHKDWGAKQLVNSVKLGGDTDVSLLDKSMGYIEGMESQKRSAFKDVMNVEEHMKPLTELLEVYAEKRNSESNKSFTNMTPEEQFFEAQRSMEERTMESIELQSVSTKVRADISAASINASFSLATFSMVKELSTGCVSLVKNIINNTR